MTMKGFGKFITFVGITGAALAGLWYFCESNKDKCACSCDDEKGSEKKAGERSYVSLDPDTVEEVKDAAKEVKKAASDVAKDVREAVSDNKDTLKKAVKSAAHDIMAKAEDAARGVGLVKDGKKTSDFEFEDFDRAEDKGDDNASHIDIQ